MLSRDDLIAYINAKHKETIHHTLGIRVEAYEPRVVVAIDADERLHQHSGIVHGGVYVLLAESAASLDAALVVDISKYSVAGMEINANHLRRVTSGTLRAIPELIHQGRSSLVYGIEIRDDTENLVSVARCTIAVRPWSVVGSKDGATAQG